MRFINLLIIYDNKEIKFKIIINFIKSYLFYVFFKSFLDTKVTSTNKTSHLQQLMVTTGLHFNITEGWPLSKDVKSLTDDGGMFRGKEEMLEKCGGGVVDFEDVGLIVCL